MKRVSKKQLFDLFLTFLKIGAFTFGGGYAMISLIDEECVEKKKWISSEDFMNMTVIAESTPGPVAINCATYTGYQIGGMYGAVAATFGVVLPSFLIILLISLFFEQFLSVAIVEKAFKGIRVAVSLLILRAGVRLMKKMLKEGEHRKINLFLVLLSFGIVFITNLLTVRISTILLIVIFGFTGFLIFGITDGRGGKK